MMMSCMSMGIWGKGQTHFFKKSSLKSLSLEVTSVGSIVSGSFWTAAASGQHSKLWVRRFIQVPVRLTETSILSVLDLRTKMRERGELAAHARLMKDDEA